MASFVSIIIPNYNGGATIGKCLEAVFACKYKDFEVIVVDDCSRDNSLDVIKKFPCKLVRLDRHSGASKARNMGVAHSSGNVLFFTDADCLLTEDALAIADRTLSLEGPNTLIGGTYTCMPYDNGFFSLFQSIFVNYSETRQAANPDYIATHAMIIDAQNFRKNKGFAENFLPILEDVEFSHRLRRAGHRLVMNPDIQVQHIFNFSLTRSLRNALIKSMYWAMYSINNRDLLADSGTASAGLKINVTAHFVSVLLLLVFSITGNGVFVLLVSLALVINLFANRGLLLAFYRTKGLLFTVAATTYYLLLYPLAVGAGVLAGAVKYLFTAHPPRENA